MHRKGKPQQTLLGYKRVKMKYYEIEVMYEATFVPEFSDLDAYALHQILLTIINLPSSVQKDLFWICVS